MSGNATPFDELLARLDNGSISTRGRSGATPVFYSGAPADGAGERNWQRAERHQALEPSSRYRVDDTEGGKAIVSWRDKQPQSTAVEKAALSAKEGELWDAASHQFARHASGDVRAFVDGAKVGVHGNTAGAVFAQVEVPELLANKQVRTINGIPREALAATYAARADHLEGARAVISELGARAGAAETSTAEIVAHAASTGAAERAAGETHLTAGAPAAVAEDLAAGSRFADATRGVLEGAGKVAVPLGVAASALELRQAYAADGGHVGDHTGHAAARVAGGWAGAAAGAEGGAALGAAVGSVVPGVGTAAGGVVGGVVGGIAGGIGGSEIADRSYQWGKNEWHHWFGGGNDVSPAHASAPSPAPAPAPAPASAADIGRATWRHSAGLPPQTPGETPPPTARPAIGARMTS